MKNIFNILSAIKGSIICFITYKSEVKFNKANTPFENVVKVVSTCMKIGTIYENAVNNRTETDFHTEKLPWGQWAVFPKIIAHNGKYYARFTQINGVHNHKITTFYIDGKPATKEQTEIILKAIPKKQHSKKQLNAGIMPKEQVKPINILFDNIIKLKVNGQTYEFDDAEYTIAV